jgi:hypothetical protein
MHRHPLRNSLSFLLLLVAGAASAEVYRWVDEQGQVHFEDRSQSQSANGARSYAPPAAIADNPQQRMEKTRKLLNAYQAERQQAREQKQQRQQEQAKRTRQCAIARDRLRQYQQYGAVYRLDDAGKRVYLSEQERAALIQRSRDDIARWCS